MRFVDRWSVLSELESILVISANIWLQCASGGATTRWGSRHRRSMEGSEGRATAPEARELCGAAAPVSAAHLAMPCLPVQWRPTGPVDEGSGECLGESIGALLSEVAGMVTEVVGPTPR